jgi:hypothetical protein
MGKGSNFDFQIHVHIRSANKLYVYQTCAHYTSIRVVLFLILPVISIGSGFLPIAHLDV